MVSVDLAFDTATVGGIDVRVYNGQINCDAAGVPTPAALQTTLGLSTNDTNPNLAGEADLTAFYTTLTLTAPVPIINGQQYTVCAENRTGGVINIAGNNTDPYASGEIYLSAGGGFVPALDSGFRINVTPTAAAASSAAAPLSPKGYIALAFSFLGLAWHGNRRKKLKANHV